MKAQAPALPRMAGLGLLLLALAGLGSFPSTANPLAQAWSLAALASAVALSLARPMRPQLLGAGWLLLGLPLLLALPGAGFAGLAGFGALAWALAALYLGQWLSAEGLLPALALAAVPFLLAQAALCAAQAWLWLPAAARDLSEPAAAAIAARGRAFGSFAEPNLLAAFCILFAPLLLALALAGQGAARRIAAWLGLLAAGACLGLAKPLAGLAGLGLGLAYLAWAMRRQALGKIFAAGSLLGLLGLFAALAQRSAAGSLFWQDHLPIWKAAWAAFSERPWLGSGGGLLAQEAFRSACGQVPGAYGLYAHNLFLSILVSHGLLGLLGMALWAALVAARLLKGAGRKPLLWHAGLAGLLGLLAQSLTDIPLEFIEIWAPALVILGALLGPAHPGLGLEQGREPAQGALPIRPWLLALLALFVLFFRGGLMPWQPLAAWAGLALILLPCSASIRLPGDAMERLGLWGLAWLLAGALLGINPALSLQAFGALAGAYALWAVLRRAAPSDAGTALAAAAWLGLAAALAALALSFWLPGHGRPWGEAFRLAGVRALFPNADLLAGYLASTLPLFFIAPSPRWRRLALPAAVLACIALALCQSRGALLAVAVAAMVHALRQAPGRARWLLPGLAALALALALAWAGMGGALASKLAPGAEAQAGADPLRNARLAFWKASAGSALAQAPLGSGLGTFGQAIEQQPLPRPLAPDNRIARFGMRLEHAHQELLEWAVEAGLPGLLILLGLLAMALLWLRQALPQPAQEAALAGLTCQAMFDFNLHCLPLLLLAMMLAASLFPLKSAAGRPAGQGSGARAQAVAMGLALLLGLAAAAHLWRLGPAASLDEHAKRRTSICALQGLDARAWSEKAQLEEQLALAGARPAGLPAVLASHLKAVAAAPAWPAGHFALAGFLERCANSQDPRLCGQALGSLLPDWGSTFSVDDPCARILHVALHEQTLGLAQQPWNVFEHRNAARLWLRLGKPEMAMAELERAVLLEPNYLAAWEALENLKVRSIGGNRNPSEEVNRIKQAGFIAASPYEIALIKTSK
jgi:O-antigen ligase